MKSSLLLHLLLLIATSASVVETYKILFYTNLFGHSHVKMLAAAADVLTDAGHNVTVLMPVFAQNLSTSLKSTKNTIFVEATEEVANFAKLRKKFMANMWMEDNANPLNLLKRLDTLSKVFRSQCKQVLSQSDLIEKLRAENYDLAITEPFDTCAYAFFEAIEIRAHVAVLSSSRLDHVSDVIGQPAALSYNPGLLSNNGERMTRWQRFVNAIQYASGSYFFGYVGDQDAAIARDINATWRSWRDTLPEASFILTNQIPLLDFPAPTFDKIVAVGGLSVKTDRKSLKLEEKWSRILDVRKKNVFISFGSNVRSVDMPDEYKKSLLQVFASMPDTSFIWKYEDANDPIVDHLDNVYLGEWLPQNELLADPRLSVFVTHGGLGSVTELAMMGKPCVMVPLFADQSRNAQMLKRHGGAAVLTRPDLSSPDPLRQTLENVMSEPKYRQNAERLAEMLINQPTKPRETLLKYVEFAARFGKLPSLDNYGRHQSYIEYYFLDIIALLVVVTSLIVYFNYRVAKWAMGRWRSAEKAKNE
ncbi:unnamed protein product [Caenorhabditis sp. 36 PRJEB53466]|nr:unnamed protein product [Caenorhabditis sp. 36 PRJEB53466]